jgi:hypothetical protein
VTKPEQLSFAEAAWREVEKPAQPPPPKREDRETDLRQAFASFDREIVDRLAELNTKRAAEEAAARAPVAPKTKTKIAKAPSPEEARGLALVGGVVDAYKAATKGFSRDDLVSVSIMSTDGERKSRTSAGVCKVCWYHYRRYERPGDRIEGTCVWCGRTGRGM